MALKSFSVGQLADCDNDGFKDFLVSRTFNPNQLFRNNADGTFTDVTVETNTLAYRAGMSASFADYDNDGRLDIYVMNIRSDAAWFAQSPTISAVHVGHLSAVHLGY